MTARRLTLGSIVLGCSLAFNVIVSATPARAAGVCSFNPSTHVATVSPPEGSVELKVVRDGANVTVNGQVCGTISTLDTMELELGAWGGTLEFNLSGGFFAPGFTDEGNGSSEIEFFVEGSAAAALTIEVYGSISSDDVEIGQRLLRPQLVTGQVINLMAHYDRSTGPADEDVTITGGVRAFLLSGREGPDVLSGAGTGVLLSSSTSVPVHVFDGSGADVVTGGSARDTFYPPGDEDEPDEYTGGAGKDVFDNGQRFDPVYVALNAAADDGIHCPGAQCEGDKVGTDIERVVGSSFSDELIGNGAPNVLLGNDGDDTLRGGGGNDDLAGGDLGYLTDWDGEDEIFGGRGSDTLLPRPLPFGGQEGRMGITVTLDDVHNDHVEGENFGVDNVHSDVETIIGTPLPDRLVGSAGADRLVGRGESDVLDGRGGDDVILPGAREDRVDGGSGADTVSYSDLREPVFARLSDPAHSSDMLFGLEHVIGTPFADTLDGSGGPNVLTGGKGRDVLRGLAGDDRLVGGVGDDELNGGAGSDVCRQGTGTGPRVDCES